MAIPTMKTAPKSEKLGMELADNDQSVELCSKAMAGEEKLRCLEFGLIESGDAEKCVNFLFLLANKTIGQINFKTNQVGGKIHQQTERNNFFNFHFFFKKKSTIQKKLSSNSVSLKLSQVPYKIVCS